MFFADVLILAGLRLGYDDRRLGLCQYRRRLSKDHTEGDFWNEIFFTGWKHSHSAQLQHQLTCVAKIQHGRKILSSNQNTVDESEEP